MNTEIQPALGTTQAETSSEFAVLWRHFKRHRYGILGLAMIGAIGGALYAHVTEPLYRASLNLLIEPRANRLVNVADVYDPGTGTTDYYGTQYEILRSRDLASRVVKRLNLVEHPDFSIVPKPGIFDPGGALDWRLWLGRMPYLNLEFPAPEALDISQIPAKDLHERAVSIFLTQLLIEPVARTQLVRVHYFALTPQLAADAANALGDVYIENSLEARLEATQRATAWLNDKISELRKKLETSERALQQFREQQQLVIVGGMRGLVDAEILDNSRRLRDAQKVKTELSSTYQKIRQAGNNPLRLKEITALFNDPAVQRTNTSLLEAEEQIKQVEERYGDKHPQMSLNKARLDNAQRALNDQLRLAAEGVRTQYEIALETERQLTEVVARDKQQVRDLDRKEYELSVLVREAQVNRELYDVFLTRFKETDSTSNFEPVNARVIDAALVPRNAYSPQRSKSITIGGLLGLLIGLMLAVVRTLLNESIRTPDELEEISQVATLGVLPLVTSRRDRNNLVQMFTEQPRTSFSEGIRSVRAALQLSEIDQRSRRVVVTSAMPSEGKTSVTCALGMALAAKEKVILIEGDMRLPNLKKAFRMPREQAGLIECLMHQVPLEQCIWRDEASGLDIMPIAKRPPNPGEVAGSEALENLLKQLDGRYDRIIIDTPPCQAASDAAVLASHADAVIFVVSADATNRRVVSAAIKQLRTAQVRLLGCVLNQIDVRKNRDIYSGYYYAYNYYGK